MKTSPSLQAAVAEADITPALGSMLVAELNTRVATAIATALVVRALVFSSAEQRLVLITFDLAGLPAESNQRIVQRLHSQYQLPPEAIIMSCSHTRGAPITAPLLGAPQLDQSFLQQVEAAALQAVGNAIEMLEPAALGVGRARLPHVMYNHRFLTRNYRAISAWIAIPPNEVLEPEGATDPLFSVLVLRNKRGFPICLVWSIAADLRFAQDGSISADVPGLVQQQIDSRIGHHVPCLYLPGCAGDSSFNHSQEAVTEAICNTLMAVYLETPADPQIRLAAKHTPVVLPIRDSNEFWSRPDIELKWPAAVAAYADELAAMRQQGAHAIPADLHTWRLGSFAIAGLPGLPFASLGMQIRAHSPARETLLACNSGGYVGPIPTRAAFSRGGYETWPARGALLGPGAGEFIVGQTNRMLAELWQQP